MLDDLRRYVGQPAPLADPATRFDPVVGVEPDPGRPGGFLARTADGRILVGEFSCPVPGTIRLRMGSTADGLGALGSSPMLVAGPGTPMVLQSCPGGVRASGGGRECTWRPRADGLVAGRLRSAPAYRPLDGPPPGIGVLLEETGEVWGTLYSFAIGVDDAVYGGGESYQGPDLRGRVRRCINREATLTSGLDASYLTVPLFLSDGGWGVFVHTGAPVRADVGSTHPHVLALDAPGADSDVFLYDGSVPAVLDAHQRLTGRPGEFPDWALGVWSSRCTYDTAAEVRDIVDGYARVGCPVDVVHVDAWESGNVFRDFTTTWEVDRARFPAGWAASLKAKGVRLSLWHNPYLRPESAVGRDAAACGVVLRAPDGTPAQTPDLANRWLVDFTNADGCTWWRRRVTELVRTEGASAVKPDFAEEVPLDAVCADGRRGWQLRNEYALRYQHESHTALAEATGSPAVALFCRSGTAGSQRYPTHWVGDTPSTWEGLATALRACLSLSLSGFGFATSDIGGFWVPKPPAAEPDAFESPTGDIGHPELTADVPGELFARWAQWGALSAVMRFHGAGQREPWAYPDPYGPVAVEACRLRARLRGYLVAAARAAHVTGAPLMRPMPWAFPGDRAARDAVLQYLLGPNILVAPVLAPGGEVRLWVPAGEWTGLAGAPTLSGPSWHNVQLELADVPAWVRAGVQVLDLSELPAV